MSLSDHHIAVPPNFQVKSLLRAGWLGMALLFGAIGGGAALIPLDGAVIASGQIMVQGKALPVQSLEPGIVASVAVQNGDLIKAGALILSLDPTLHQSRLDIAMEQLASALAEEARLNAEAAGLAAPDFTLPALPFDAPDLGMAAERQTTLFAARQAQRAQGESRLSESDAQLQARIAGITAQITAATQEASLLAEDMARQGDLVSKGLARQAPLADLQRQEAILSGRIATLEAERVQLEGARREANLALAQEQGQRDAEIAEGLRNTTARIQELKSQIISLREALARTELRAPTTGIVHELTVPAPGAVISSGTVLAQIVPTGRDMEIEVAVNPRDIDHVHTGQAAEVMVTAFDSRAVPRLDAKVVNVPPGAVKDPATGQSYYRVMLALDAGEVAKNGHLRPGMQVEAFLATGTRSVLSWLMAPLMQPFSHALRER